MRVTKKNTVIGLALAASVIFSASSCEESARPSAGEAENTSRLNTYERLVQNQPAQTMNYSPTRATKNFWVETWDEPGKLSYVYLMNASGDHLGYYVFEGLPVSYCTGLIPPYQLIKADGGDYKQDFVVPGPSVDGTYSSSANCNTYYGKDATTGSYLEYTAGMGINVLVFEEPMQRQDVEPLGPTNVSDVKR